MQLDPRHIALKVLLNWHKASWTLDRSLLVFSETISTLPKNDRNLCNAIIYGVLRRRETIDWIICAFSNTRFEKIDLTSLYVLRLGLFQILYMNRIPAFAAIHNAVGLSKKISGEKTAGFVNAVLRKASDHHAHVSFPDKKTALEKYISVQYALPLWLSKKWVRTYGMEETQKLCAGLLSIPPITICCNSLKTTPQDLMQQLQDHVENMQLAPYAGQGICFSNPHIPIQQLEAFGLGLFHVQDEAAQIVSEYLAPEPGENILDACAGFGGKSFYLAQKMKNTGLLTATDVESEKLDSLKSNAKRLGIDIIITKQIDIQKSAIKDFDDYFDRVLVDCPCSGLGVLGRNPDTKWKRSMKDIERLSARQKKILNAAASLVKPGGVLVYAVCSCEKEENEDVINAFLEKRKDFFIDKDFYSDKYALFMTNQGFFKTYPAPGPMDGFFAARLIRKTKTN